MPSNPEPPERSHGTQPLGTDPDEGGATLARATRSHRAGNLGEAERLYRSILKGNPGDAAALNQLGVLAAQTGRRDLAAELIGRAIEVEPGNSEFHYNAGLAAQSLGDRAAAIACYRRALDLHPDYADALANLGNLLIIERQASEAEDCFRRALELNPGNPGYHNNLGTVLMAQHRNDEAEACFREALRLKPDFPEALNGLGLAVAQLGQHDDAVRSFREALRIRPDNATVLTNLGVRLFADDKMDEAESCYREALRIRPDYILARSKLALLMVERGDFQAAHESYDTILKSRPDSEVAWAGKAKALDKMRDTGAADEIVLRFVTDETVPANFAELYSKLARRQGRQAEAVSRLERQLARDDVSPDDRRLLHFALAYLHDNLGSYDAAFESYARANALRPANHDPAKVVQKTDSIVSFFGPERFAGLPRAANRSRLPVFIVGMPRSGTSLVEQILSCHPEVFGAGEIRDIERMSEALLPGLADEAGAPAALDRERLDEAAERHLKRLGDLGQGAGRVTDKMPFNFRHLGLIALLFPGARVIHCVRDPLDVCLSCYFQNFGTGNLYSFDLAHTGSFYRQYDRLMAHWRDRLDLPMLEVRYEDHVAEPERVCRALLAFLDLEWDPACLAFHESRRVVKTASQDQVRRPIYTSSAGRWRNYEHHLEALKRDLADLL